jgi:hypothetical protein
LPIFFAVESISDAHRKLSSLPVKSAGLAITDPTVPAKANWWSASTVIYGYIIAKIRGTTIYCSADNLLVLNNGKTELCKHSLEASENKM